MISSQVLSVIALRCAVDGLADSKMFISSTCCITSCLVTKGLENSSTSSCDIRTSVQIWDRNMSKNVCLSCITVQSFIISIWRRVYMTARTAAVLIHFLLNKILHVTLVLSAADFPLVFLAGFIDFSFPFVTPNSCILFLFIFIYYVVMNYCLHLSSERRHHFFILFLIVKLQILDHPKISWKNFSLFVTPISTILNTLLGYRSCRLLTTIAHVPCSWLFAAVSPSSLLLILPS